MRHARHIKITVMTANEITIILLGDSGVGKTSLMLHFESGHFKERRGRTLVKRCKKTVTVKDTVVELCIWDMSGLLEHRSIIQCYYERVQGALLVYDVTKEASFKQLNSWLDEFKSYNTAAHVMIVGNKNEDPVKKSVTEDKLRDYAKQKDLEYMEVSAKSGENINTVFLSLAEKILRARGVLGFLDDPELEKKCEISEAAQESVLRLSDYPSFQGLENEQFVTVEDVDGIYDYMSQTPWTHFS